MGSEPVGNRPRNLDIPGNSHKAREAESTPEPIIEKDPIQKIIEGKVVRKKVPWYKRVATSMIAEDAGSVREYLIDDVVGPALRNLVRDMVVGSVDRTLFGQARTRRNVVGGGPVSSIRNKYHDVPTERPRVLSRESRARHDFDDIVLDSRSEALEVIEFLVQRIEKYNVATVSDLYDALGVTGDFAAQRWGWTDLRDAYIRQTRAGFLLDLPRPESLR